MASKSEADGSPSSSARQLMTACTHHKACCQLTGTTCPFAEGPVCPLRHDVAMDTGICSNASVLGRLATLHGMQANVIGSKHAFSRRIG